MGSPQFRKNIVTGHGPHTGSSRFRLPLLLLVGERGTGKLGSSEVGSIPNAAILSRTINRSFNPFTDPDQVASDHNSGQTDWDAKGPALSDPSNGSGSQPWAH
jgi:hypothetical protein